MIIAKSYNKYNQIINYFKRNNLVIVIKQFIRLSLNEKEKFCYYFIFFYFNSLFIILYILYPIIYN